MRHNANHRGTSEDCYTCRMEEEADKQKKLELKVMQIAKTISYTKTDTVSSKERTETTTQKTRG